MGRQHHPSALNQSPEIVFRSKERLSRGPPLPRGSESAGVDDAEEGAFPRGSARVPTTVDRRDRKPQALVDKSQANDLNGPDNAGKTTQQAARAQLDFTLQMIPRGSSPSGTRAAAGA